MSNPMRDSHNQVLDLIANFRAHESAYKSPTFQEAEARKSFIDPFFTALGWDVDHRHQRNPWEQEVRIERTVDVALSQKKADYAFYLAPNFRDVRFFAEAKKPSIDLVGNVDAYFQTIRYGWSAGTPLAVLTDFEHTIVLDCRYKPHPDTVTKRELGVYHYQSLSDPEEFARLYWIISREALGTGSFDRFVGALPKAGRTGAAAELQQHIPVDESFLRELEEMRESFAKLFKQSNPLLGSEALTEITQRTIDRLVFLRFLEDRLIEPQIRLADFGRRFDPWQDFLAASRYLNSTYNGIVFKPHSELDSDDFRVDPIQFGKIAHRLSHERSPFDFNAIPIHILGSIYERFLGSEIIATAKRARVEQKPSVRKAGGVYYTPEYVVRKIVEDTVGPLIQGCEPKAVWSQRIADIACGSGSFLISAYDFLLEYLYRWYNEKELSKSEREERDRKATNHGCILDNDGLWKLGLRLRRDVLVNCIFGVDLDKQAVEVSQLSLFLKLLEHESSSSARQFFLEISPVKSTKLLPDLTKNVVAGNSLIGWDISRTLNTSTEDEIRLRPLDFAATFPQVFKDGGFDAIVGNPPYVLLQDSKFDEISNAYLRKSYKVASYKLDTYHLFFERAISLLRPNARIGFITPSNFLTNNRLVGLRKMLLEDVTLESILIFDGKVFDGASVDTAISIAARSGPTGAFRLLRSKAGGPDIVPSAVVELQAKNCLADKHVLLTPASAGADPILDLLDSAGLKLADVADVNFGKQLRDRKKFPRDVIQVEDLSSIPRTHVQCVTGKDITRFRLEWSGLACLKSREAQSGGCWDEKKHDAKPKLLTRQIGRFPNFAIDSVGFHCLNTLFMVTTKGDAIDAYFLAGILNSSSLRYYWTRRFVDQRETFPKIKGTYLKLMPIPRLDAKLPRHQAIQDQIARLVRTAEAARVAADDSREANREHALRKAAFVEGEIDVLVAELFGLTAEQLAAIGSTLAENSSTGLPADE